MFAIRLFVYKNIKNKIIKIGFMFVVYTKCNYMRCTQTSSLGVLGGLILEKLISAVGKGKIL